jgi:hypothetical protein
MLFNIAENNQKGVDWKPLLKSVTCVLRFESNDAIITQFFSGMHINCHQTIFDDIRKNRMNTQLNVSKNQGSRDS